MNLNRANLPRLTSRWRKLGAMSGVRAAAGRNTRNVAAHDRKHAGSETGRFHSKRSLGKTPVPAARWFLFRRQFVLGIFFRVLEAFLVAGVVAQPELHIVLAPNAQEVVEPAAARTAAGQMCRVTQTALPEFSVEFTVSQMVTVQDVETAQGEVVEEFPENRREGFVGDLGGRQERNLLFYQLLRGWRPIFRLAGAQLRFERGIRRRKRKRGIRVRF